MSDSKGGSRRLKSSYLSSVISISLVLFMLGMLGLLMLNAKKISDYVKEHVQINVFLNDNVTDPEVSALQTLLEKNEAVRSVRYISKQEALDSLKKDLGPDASGMLDENPLPASFEIKLKADFADAATMQTISSDLQRSEQVKEVTFRQSEVEQMNENFRLIAIVLLCFCVLLFFIAIALINSTIRLSMYSRRFLIKSMQLVGATKGFIRWPFLKRSVAHGFYAGLLAVVLLAGLIYVIETKLPEFEQLRNWKEVAYLFGGIFCAGILLSALSTFFAVNRFLRVRVEDLYG